LGGDTLTPTDVWLLLGYLEPGEFLGGRRQLDVEPARAVAAALAEKLGTTIEDTLLQAKAAIRRELTEHLRAWAAHHPALGASDPASRWLFSYGGGGGLLCVEAAEALGIRRVVVFPHSSVFSAFGAGLLPIAHFYQTVVPAGSDDAAIAAAVLRLADNARRDLRAEGVRTLAQVNATLTFGADRARTLTLADLLQAPEAFARADQGAPVAVRVGLDVSVPHEVAVEMITAENQSNSATPGRERRVLSTEGAIAVPVHAGLGDPNAAPVPGPAFLQAPDTTIFVPGDWSVTFTPQGYGILSQEDQG
jgi:N-methylhydantoinase A